jgi:hypothetical protein
MMMYSVWNRAARRYDYYQTSEVGPTHAPAPTHVRSSGLGATPEEAAWPLPAGAKLVGHGELPRGRVARAGGGGLALGSTSSSGAMVALAALGTGLYVLWEELKL